MGLSDYPTIMKAVSGSLQPWEFAFFGNDDLAEDLSSITRYLVQVKECPGESPLFTLDSNVLSVNVAGGVVTFILTSMTLSAGTYVMDVALYDGSNWFYTDLIELHVTLPVTDVS